MSFFRTHLKTAMHGLNLSSSAPQPPVSITSFLYIHARKSTTFHAISSAYARTFLSGLVGQEELRESLIVTLIAGGHILIESVPGLQRPLPLAYSLLVFREVSNVFSALPILCLLI